MTGEIKVDLTEGAQLDRLPERILQAAHEALEEQAALMRDYAKVFCPVDTGSLRDSIRVEEFPTRDPNYSRGIRVRAGGYVTNPKTGRIVDYAIYAEAKSPYMALAWEMVADQIMTVLEVQVPGMVSGSE